MPRTLAGLILYLGVGAHGVDARSPNFELDPAQLDTLGAPCLSAHNQGRDIIAEYLDAEGNVTLRAGSWLGRDGRYLLPPPDANVDAIRFRALEDIAIEPPEVSLEPCPDSLPVAATESLIRAIDYRLDRYLGEPREELDLPGLYANTIEALNDTPNRHWLAVAHFEFASFLRAADQLDEASSHYETALSIFDVIADLGGRAASTNSLGLVALRQGKLDTAAQRFEAAQPLFLQSGHLHSVAGVDNNLGLLYMKQGQLGEAATHLEMALSVFQGPIDLRSAAPNAVEVGGAPELTWALNTLNNLAIVRRRQGAVNLAERYWRNVLALEGHVTRARTAAEARHNLGGLLLRQGRLDEALVTLSEAVEQFDAAKARRWMVETRVMLSQLYFHLGDPELSLEYARNAVELQPHDLNARLRAYRHLSDLQQQTGDHDAAVATIEEAMKLVENRPGDRQLLLLQSRRAHLDLLVGNIADAVAAQRSVHESISELDQVVETARVGYRLAVALMQSGDTAEAEAILDDALAVFQQTREVFHELLVLEALGKLRSDDPAARLDVSTRAFERALELRTQPLGDARRLGMSAALGRIDDHHIQLLVDKGEPTRAWQAAARVRATEMLDLERAHRRGQNRRLREDLLDEHAELMTALHHRRLNGDDGSASKQRQLDIDRVEARLRQLRDQPRIPSGPALASVQQRLEEDHLLLSYYLLPDRVLLWAISATDSRLFELPDRPQIEAKSSELLARLRHPRQAPGAIERLARELGEALVGPAAEMIAEADELVIEPHGMLHSLPFGVLIDDERVLVERVAVHRIVSFGREPTQQRAMDSSQGRMMVMANPGWQVDRELPGPLPRRSLVSRLMSDNLLGQLPGTQREAELLSALGPTSVDVRVRTGRMASRQFLLGGGLSGYPLIHIATHGLVDLQYPSLSALLLADEHGPGPALLRPQEIAELNLDAGLVVLSGCETGMGPIPAGGGALSLARPFLVAGARQVMSTLWKIDDQRTGQFMQAFYRHLLIEGATPARALAAAQREMRQHRATAHPYYWAGFVLTTTSLDS